MEQCLDEAAWLLKLIAGSGSLLEIGSRRGGFLRQMAHVCRPGAKICSIDLGRDIEGNGDQYYGHELEQTVAGLCRDGYAAECLISSSREPSAIAWAKERAPFDFIFIDGDHSYEGVKADWENYGGLSGIVGFHDIMHEETKIMGTGRFWNEVSPGKKTITIRASERMGIGVLFQVIPI